MTEYRSVFASKSQDWRDRLSHVVETMRELSRHTDPVEMSRAYSERMRGMFPTDRFIALSRRDMTPPYYRITRYSGWTNPPDPWRERDRHPVFKGGLLGTLLYSNEPWVIDDLRIPADDPAFDYLSGMGSMLAIPHYDRGVAVNMACMLRAPKRAFNHDELPEVVWVNNLYGRLTHSLVLSDQVRAAYQSLDDELRSVADIQRSLLPNQLPAVPGLDLAAHYQTSRRAGGDYYDFFPLPDGRWGILIADVSGHGTPAAVIMAVTHTIAHTYAGPPTPPGELLEHVNRVLSRHYTDHSGAFVTAFYAIYDPAARRIDYCSAGHNPPRLKRCSDGSLSVLNGAQRLPLGILETERYPEASYDLKPGDQLILYTDGITEVVNPAGDQFGAERLDAVLATCGISAQGLLADLLAAVTKFTEGRPSDDDQTLVVARVTG